MLLVSPRSMERFRFRPPGAAAWAQAGHPLAHLVAADRAPRVLARPAPRDDPRHDAPASHRHVDRRQ